MILPVKVSISEFFSIKENPIFALQFIINPLNFFIIL